MWRESNETTGTQRGWQRNTALFLGSQALTMLGSSLVQYAIMWYIILETNSGAMMTLYVLAGFLPHVLVSPFAGVLADRFDRKKIIIAADLSIAGVTLILAIIFLQGYRPYWLLLLASLLRSMGSGIQTPAVSAILPTIVPEDKLLRVGGINSSMQSLIFILSPACGGIVLTVSNLVTAFFVDLATAVVGVGILLFLAIPPTIRPDISGAGGYFRDLKDGCKYAWNHQYIRLILIFYALFCVCLAPISFLSPVFIARNFGGDVLYLTLQEVIFSSGSVLGGLAISCLGNFKNKGTAVGLATMIYGGLCMFLGFSPILIVFYLITAVIGFVMPWCNTSLIVILQERVDQEVMGRIFSLVALVGAATSPLGMVVFGPMADVINITYIFLGSGLAMVVLGIAFMCKRQVYAPKEDKGYK